jgi:hypothetical protein
VFVKKYSLTDIVQIFKGITWDQLLQKPDTFFGKSAERIRKAIFEECDETEQIDQLILEDIAIFTGQKPLGCSSDLKNYRLEGEGEEFSLPIESTNSSIPAVCRCPLTKKLMHDPVIWGIDGLTYEKSAIIAHILRKYSGTDV